MRPARRRTKCHGAGVGFDRASRARQTPGYDEHEDERIAREKSAAEDGARALVPTAKACATDPQIGEDCPAALCSQSPKECGAVCQDKRDARFCHALGVVLETGNEHMTKNATKSLAFRVLACELDVAVAPDCISILCGEAPQECAKQCTVAKKADHCYAFGLLVREGYAENLADEAKGSALLHQACSVDEEAGPDCKKILNEPSMPQ